MFWKINRKNLTTFLSLALNGAQNNALHFPLKVKIIVATAYPKIDFKKNTVTNQIPVLISTAYLFRAKSEADGVINGQDKLFVSFTP